MNLSSSLTYLKVLLSRYRHTSANKRELTYQMADVSSSFTQFDIESLRVIQSAPVWMSRAERLLLYTLTFTLRPTRYLEIGTLKGGSALIVCAAMDALGSDGRIVCIDPKPQIEPDIWEKLKHRTTLITGFSPQAVPEAVDNVGGTFDLVLIDGDHSEAGALRDAFGVVGYVSPSAYILFHDSYYSEVMTAVDRFCASNTRQLVDFGSLTREVTLQTTPDNKTVHWGGLRMVQMRR